MKGPMFSYFGAKWRTALKYPAPRYDTIVELFAGSACYASRYAHKQVILCEAYEPVAILWDYLIRAPESEILSLPDLGARSVDDFPHLPTGARYLIGYWCNAGVATPRKTISKWYRDHKAGKYPGSSPLYWGPRVRERVADQQKEIRHWEIRFGDFRSVAPYLEHATYFIDPPYQVAGKNYGFKETPYSDIAMVARHGPGQRIVCETEGANWLPFRPFLDARARPSAGSNRISKEVIWTDDML